MVVDFLSPDLSYESAPVLAMNVNIYQTNDAGGGSLETPVFGAIKEWDKTGSRCDDQDSPVHPQSMDEGGACQ